MIKYKDSIYTKQIEDKVICDMCQQDIQGLMGSQPDYVQVRHEFGYGSDKDGDYWEFDLCETCLEKLIDTAGIKARKYTQSEFMKSEFGG